MLNILYGYIYIYIKNLNTTLVNVKQYIVVASHLLNTDLNTTLVNVKL